MNFKKWVVKKYLYKDNPYGDFARDISIDTRLSNDDKQIFKILDLTDMSFEAKNIYNELKLKYLGKV